ADILLIKLAKEALHLCGIHDVRIHICDPGIVRQILSGPIPDPRFTKDVEETIYTYLQNKNRTDLSAFLDILSQMAFEEMSADVKELFPLRKQALLGLLGLFGNREVIQKAREVLPAVFYPQEILASLDKVCDYFDDVYIDLSDVGSYAYHSGLSFSLYALGWRSALVQGGRYDGAGKAFGRYRHATGFSLNLKSLIDVHTMEKTKAIRADFTHDKTLHEYIQQLREAGNIVIEVFPNSTETYENFVFVSKIVKKNGTWCLEDF
ncbi:ATP phosphoribosyltransferase regulatory subunit, partial [Basilea psittacipulmonis]